MISGHRSEGPGAAPGGRGHARAHRPVPLSLQRENGMAPQAPSPLAQGTSAMESEPPRSGSSARTDQDLMECIRADSSAALQELMSRHWSPIAQYSYRMLGDADEAQDIAQEVFASVWEHRARWTTYGSVNAYLHRIARNLALSRLRKSRVRLVAADEIRRSAPKAPSPIDDASRGELRAALEAALAALPPRRREAFILVRIQGLSLTEAAEIMGVIPQTVANQAYHAALEMSAYLAPYLP